MGKSAASDFMDNYDDSYFPADFLLTYEALECLGHNEMGETFLARDRQTGINYVAKCYEKNAVFSHTLESDLLKELNHSGLPSFIGVYENEIMQCVVREFTDGNTLDILSQNLRFTREQVIAICIQLCDLLTYLHGHTPPIIHRDIKPQNVIMDKDGKISLIDFGISRFYNENVENDTICFGTMEFSPPEQYGFAQTDCRADIFSFGVLLYWLLTGATDTKNYKTKIKDKQLRHIIHKCVAFAPEKRYSSAKRLMVALIRVKHQTYNKATILICAMLACSLFLFAGFSIGRYTDIAMKTSTKYGVEFDEPLIEQAVRLILNKQADDLISVKELLHVRELYICGNHVANSQEEFDNLCQHMFQDNGNICNGEIQSLQDVAKLKNLNRLNIVLQDISDLAPLKNLRQLEQVELKHNPIEDVSPLNGLADLRYLYLYDTYITDLSVLSDCPKLYNLVVGYTNITSLDAFTGIKSLTCLHAEQLSLKSLSGIEKYTSLEEIGLSRVLDGDLTPLLLLPNLKKVYLGEDLKEAAQKIAYACKFEIIYEE